MNVNLFQDRENATPSLDSQAKCWPSIDHLSQVLAKNWSIDQALAKDNSLYGNL